MNDKQLKDYWDHPNYDANYLGQNSKRNWMIANFRKLVTSKVPTQDKIVLDFGCGGGLLGYLILDEFGARKYIGYDVSSESIRIAKENLQTFSNAELICFDKHVWDFASKKPDIFVSIACIIHFRTLKYLTNFLHDVNKCGAEYLVLEICDKGIGNSFLDVATNNTQFGPRKVCTTDELFVSSQLKSYSLVEKTDPKKNNLNDMFLYYRRVRA